MVTVVKPRGGGDVGRKARKLEDFETVKTFGRHAHVDYSYIGGGCGREFNAYVRAKNSQTTASPVPGSRNRSAVRSS